MKYKLRLFALFYISSLMAQAQSDDLVTSLDIADPAPPLKLREWLKGKPFKSFEKGKVYVVEFWATWCQPCKAAMPRLSLLAKQHHKDVTFLGIDVKEMKPMNFVRHFVDSMGGRMNYLVAAEDSNYMTTAWLEASGEPAIPRTFIVNRDGKIAWIGHPMYLEETLPRIVNNSWNIDSALAKRNLDKHLARLDSEVYHELVQYRSDPLIPGDPGKPDSVLAAIDKMLEKEPRLRYAPVMAGNTFNALLKTNPSKAYEFGRTLMVTSVYTPPPLDIIIDGIKAYDADLLLPKEIYILGAEALELETEQWPYPELINIAKRYDQIAAWYWKASEKTKAVEAQQKAIKVLQGQANVSEKETAGYRFRLQQYNNM